MVQRFADSSAGGTPGAPAAMSGGVDDVTAREAYELAGKVAAL